MTGGQQEVVPWLDQSLSESAKNGRRASLCPRQAVGVDLTEIGAPRPFPERPKGLAGLKSPAAADVR